MKKFLTKHREILLVALIGFAIIVALNIMMLQYHYASWTDLRFLASTHIHI